MKLYLISVAYEGCSEVVFSSREKAEEYINVQCKEDGERKRKELSIVEVVLDNHSNEW